MTPSIKKSATYRHDDGIFQNPAVETHHDSAMAAFNNIGTDIKIANAKCFYSSDQTLNIEPNF